MEEEFKSLLITSYTIPEIKPHELIDSGAKDKVNKMLKVTTKSKKTSQLFFLFSVHLTIFDKSNSVQQMTFGEIIRKQREEKELLLRQAAAYLEVDTAFVSKLERGERNASREQVIKLADFLQTPQEPLLTIWLADKISSIVNNEKQGEKALKLALKNHKTK